MYSVIDPNASLGSNLEFGNFCIIESNVIIGYNCKLRNFVIVKSGTVMGSNCFMDDWTKTGAGSTIGKDVTFKQQSQIADDSVVCDGVFIGPDAMLLRGRVEGEPSSPYICSGAYLGAGCIIMPGVQVGVNAVVAAGAVVTKDVGAGKTVAGVPAKEISK